MPCVHRSFIAASGFFQRPVLAPAVDFAGLDFGEDFGDWVGILGRLTHVLKGRTWGTRFCGFTPLISFTPCFGFIPWFDFIPSFGCFWGIVSQVVEEGLDDALVLGFAEFGARGEGAVDGVGDDLFDQIGFGFAAGFGWGGFAG
jgi:hypothetical protein